MEDFTFYNSLTLNDKQSKLMEIIREDNDTFFAICRGVSETTIITSAKYRDQIMELFSGEKLISSTMNLSSITVKLPIINSEIYGIYYYILKQLAWDGINIVEVVSTANEFTAVVHQDDVDKAFRILMQLKRGL